MTLLTFKLRGFKVHYSIKHRGYEDREDYYENRIYIEVFLFNLVKIFRYEVFRESIPNWAEIKYACLGYAEWISKRPFLINASSKRKTIKTIKI